MARQAKGSADRLRTQRELRGTRSSLSRPKASRPGRCLTPQRPPHRAQSARRGAWSGARKRCHQRGGPRQRLASGFAGTMRRRVELALSRDASGAFSLVRGGLRHSDRGLWCATSRARPGGRHLEAAWLVVGPRERPDRVVRGTDGIASAALAHDPRGSEGPGAVQTDFAERHQRSRAAGARRRTGPRGGNSFRG